MKLKFFNDTGRIVTIHQATYEHVCYVDNSDAIMPLQERLFFLPDGTKLWDYGARNGLQLLVSPIE
ncbi:hypothetical protein [Niallia circulans]|uniref:hypothetical protein n=1 Tax=Niallia circulans TaxID=1397 RepID=UPI0015616447|nr:hypothetical protein [Niallia circulans]NRG33955.1 hypothetical protein [Niallia circulans]